MTRRFLLGALFCAVGFAQMKPGATAPDFTVQDLSGNAVSFASLKGDVTVVAFIATKCPISNDYNERMKAVFGDYSARGVKFVFINSNFNEPADEVREHARANGFAFSVYKDETGAVANTFGAQVTPETFVIDKAGVVRYHGYIDDSRNAARIQNQGLRLALDAVLQGAPVAAAETKAFGCTIKRGRKTS